MRLGAQLVYRVKTFASLVDQLYKKIRELWRIRLVGLYVAG